MKLFWMLVVGAAVLVTCKVSDAQVADVVGGETSVLLDVDLLSSAAGLDLSGTSADVTMGNLGDGSVAFSINPRDAANLPSTFSYTPGSLAPFKGTIEHTGSVFFNNDSIEVGNFTIGFDANRVMGDNSGFFVESTTGIAAILFDVGNVSSLEATAAGLNIEADLLVSPEFAGFLGDNGLTGADVGDAAVKAIAVPEPSALAGVVVLAGTALFRRRR